MLRSNDMRILDCAMYFTRTCGGVTFLFTHDRNLRANCEFEGERVDLQNAYRLVSHSNG